jgi:hypothetical protein
MHHWLRLIEFQLKMATEISNTGVSTVQVAVLSTNVQEINTTNEDTKES